ncbi:hypothetical protein PARPLA_00860 [Rhodobacteraceae bacterium THAF1]|uniref:DUF6473 family protein n=1 Tax=Palleronia sp. THAF1 TaxID=2587842 RepID=UPI000F416E13|nr:DUF6473 family protein [Palleronia sp. THAF1]QFU09581.1 hypothetical protein FIU81_12955 [Palleronia sp. THAF1]VDC17518.1 hypothetical protein PARPLA_00860 [Rhodobacteraceae bacterium THAF1]
MDRYSSIAEDMCRYPGAARDCRGPIKPLTQPYIALLDSRAVSSADSAALMDGIEDRTHDVCIDLSAPHSGPDAILGDPGLLEIARQADAVVLTVPGAHQLSNPYYRVHKWRNDRIIGQQDRLRALYPEIEFERHHFVRHLLEDLYAVSPGRFAVVRETLQRTWLERMGILISQLGKPVVLLWIGERRPDEECDTVHDGDPPFVTKAMAASLSVAERTEVVVRPKSPLRFKGRISPEEVQDIAAERVARCLSRLRLREGGGHRRSA